MDAIDYYHSLAVSRFRHHDRQISNITAPPSTSTPTSTSAVTTRVATPTTSRVGDVKRRSHRAGRRARHKRYKHQHHSAVLSSPPKRHQQHQQHHDHKGMTKSNNDEQDHDDARHNHGIVNGNNGIGNDGQSIDMPKVSSTYPLSLIQTRW
jgi:hypothetical protein